MNPISVEDVENFFEKQISILSDKLLNSFFKDREQYVAAYSRLDEMRNAKASFPEFVSNLEAQNEEDEE